MYLQQFPTGTEYIRLVRGQGLTGVKGGLFSALATTICLSMRKMHNKKRIKSLYRFFVYYFYLRNILDHFAAKEPDNCLRSWWRPLRSWKISEYFHYLNLLFPSSKAKYTVRLHSFTCITWLSRVVCLWTSTVCEAFTIRTMWNGRAGGTDWESDWPCDLM